MEKKITQGLDGVSRCEWASQTELYSKYHDEEWGRPTLDDRWIFEKICLEGFQAGLSWLTILNKRDSFRMAFANFEIDKVANFDNQKVDMLVKNSAIIRHRGKIESTINNAKCALKLKTEFGSLAAFFWQYQKQSNILSSSQNQANSIIPSKTSESINLSKELKRRQWGFVGPTTVYAFMQAAGIVNDHAIGCQAGIDCKKLRAKFDVPKPK